MIRVKALAVYLQAPPGTDLQCSLPARPYGDFPALFMITGRNGGSEKFTLFLGLELALGLGLGFSKLHCSPLMGHKVGSVGRNSIICLME